MSIALHPTPARPLIEPRDALIKRIATERLKAKLANLDPADIVSTLNNVYERKHGALLRAAFMESPEAFGDALMSIVVRDMQIAAEVEAKAIVEQVRGPALEPMPVRRVFRIVGDC